MVSRLAAGIVLLLVAAACTGEAEPGPETSSTSSSTPSVTTTATRAPDFGDVDAGRLAIVDSRGNVVVVGPDGSDRIDITDDAGEAFYSQPIWSPDSTRIAFGQATPDGFAVRIHRVDGTSSTVIPMSNNPFYMYWAPNGSRIGVLHNGPRGLDFEMIDVSEGTSALIDRGSPFYFSWSPHSDRVVIHEGPDRFESLGPKGEREQLGETSPGYLAPQWLTSGILHVVDGHLVLDEEPGERTALAEVTDQVMFVANPSETLVAVQALGPGEVSVAFEEVETLEPNTVSVVDLRTGSIVVADDEPTLGMWWSPDGESLLILSPVGDGRSLIAKVWSAEDGLIEYVTYRPSPIQARELFPFFPQYAQSMTFWAPDSSGFALAGEIDDQVGIWVQAVDAPDPRLVADGLWVAWSGE